MERVKFVQNICADCLQYIVNNEHRSDSVEEMKMLETLSEWNKEYYSPLGLDDDCEPFFSHCKCDLCDQIAGDRFKYVFGFYQC